MGWFVYINLFLIVLFCVAIIYFLGGVVALLRNERKAMFPIFAVNLLSFVFVLVFYLAYLFGYFTDPCYIEPMSCDDQLTDAPAELKPLPYGQEFLHCSHTCHGACKEVTVFDLIHQKNSSMTNFRETIQLLEKEEGGKNGTHDE